MNVKSREFVRFFLPLTIEVGGLGKVKQRSKSALRQCLRHCVRKGLRPLDPKRARLRKQKAEA